VTFRSKILTPELCVFGASVGKYFDKKIYSLLYQTPSFAKVIIDRMRKFAHAQFRRKWIPGTPPLSSRWPALSTPWS
jgi:hypothetical protein